MILEQVRAYEVWFSPFKIKGAISFVYRPPSVHQPEQLPERPKSHNSQLSLLSRSSDLTKYRLKKVEPEPLKPARVQSAGPEAWCPPTLHAVTAWQEIQPSEVRYYVKQHFFYLWDISLVFQGLLAPHLEKHVKTPN